MNGDQQKQGTRFAEPASDARALTLIELLVVVTLIGVSVGLVTVRLDGFSETGRLRAAARQIESVITLARVDAMTSGRPAILRYVKERAAVAILHPAVRGDEIVWTQGPGIPLGGSVRTTDVQRTADESNTGAEYFDVRVDSTGVVEAHRIVLSWANTRSITITVDGLTGHVTILPANEEGIERP